MAYTTIDDPSAYFQTATYTGNGGTQNITNDGNSDLQPDWVWVKDRTDANDHKITDSSRLSSGNPTLTLESNTNIAEFNDTDSTTAYLTDGFSLGANGNLNTNSNSYVAWQWKANGGTTSSNTDGSITSTVQADTTAGFSIVTYTGNGTAGATVGHGLGVAPTVVITKNRSTAYRWAVGHNSLTSWDYYLALNENSAETNANNPFNDTAPSSSLITLGDNTATNENTSNFISYCFAEIQGYSKFGSYTGNGNADGAFIYTGFKPAWIMIKRTDVANSWYLVDGTRGSTNVISAELEANTNGAEATANVRLDILSNGFKIRTSGAAYNASGGTYIYMCFASSPFVSSEGVPTTAR